MTELFLGLLFVIAVVYVLEHVFKFVWKHLLAFFVAANVITLILMICYDLDLL